MEKHCVEMPCNSLPLVGEADYGLAVRPMIHCDRRAPFHVMIYLLKGGMEIMEDGVPYELRPGTLFFLKSGVHHWGEKPFLNGTSWYYVHFYADAPDGAMQRYVSQPVLGGKVFLSGTENRSFLPLPKMLHLGAQNLIKKKIEQLIECHNGGDMTGSSLLLWEIFRECMKQDEDAEDDGKDKVETLMRFLRAHFAEEVTAGELEAATGLSYKYMGTLLKARTGMTIREYQLMLKLKKAEALLCGTELSMAEIAAETGFYDAFYFSRVFKRERGIAPTEFRRTYVPRI